jgi:hypothetical protein
LTSADVEAVEPRRSVPEVRTLAFNRWCVARGSATACNSPYTDCRRRSNI